MAIERWGAMALGGGGKATLGGRPRRERMRAFRTVRSRPGTGDWRVPVEGSRARGICWKEASVMACCSAVGGGGPCCCIDCCCGGGAFIADRWRGCEEVRGQEWRSRLAELSCCDSSLLSALRDE